MSTYEELLNAPIGSTIKITNNYFGKTVYVNTAAKAFKDIHSIFPDKKIPDIYVVVKSGDNFRYQCLFDESYELGAEIIKPESTN